MSSSAPTTTAELLGLAQGHLTASKEVGKESRKANFNIFEILGVGHWETRTHTPFLASLLKPYGDHGLGTFPLEKFLELVEITGLDVESATVRTEFLYPRSKDAQGGRVDILIKDRLDNRVCIENKIYASEQENQISRYQKAFENCELIYLTLDGAQPTTADARLSARLICASYREHVYDWIKVCESQSSVTPPVREILIQYRALISRLTNRGEPDAMDQELTDRILQDGLSLEAYLKLCTLKDSIERKLSEKLAKEINHVRQEFGDAFYIEPRKWGQRNQPFYFTSPSLSKAGLKLGFEFESNGYRDCFFGLCWVDEKGSESDSQDWPPAVQRIVALFREKFSKSDSSPHWPAWVYWDEHRNWGALEFNAILSDKFRDSIAATVRRVFGLFEEELIRSTEN